MKLILANSAIKDLKYWGKADKSKLQRIEKLIQAIKVNPYEGIGKPEQLKYQLADCWSRRITSEHRLVYRVDEDNETIEILQARYHYSK